MADSEEKYTITPLHVGIYTKNTKLVEEILQVDPPSLNNPLPSGDLPIHFALKLGAWEIADVLFNHGAGIRSHDRERSTALYLALAASNEQREWMINLMEKAEHAMANSLNARIPHMYKALKDVPDFQCEVDFKFSTWIPLIGRILPSETIKIWKRGTDVRMDCSLVGFEGMSWKRGDWSCLFHGAESLENCKLFVCDHIREVYADILADTREQHSKMMNKSNVATNCKPSEPETEESKQSEAIPELPESFTRTHNTETSIANESIENMESKEETDDMETAHASSSTVADDNTANDVNSKSRDQYEDVLDVRLSSPWPKMHWWSRDVEFERCKSFWTRTPQTEEVGEWTADLYDMRNLQITVEYRSAMWPEREEALKERNKQRKTLQGIEDESSDSLPSDVSAESLDEELTGNDQSKELSSFDQQSIQNAMQMLKTVYQSATNTDDSASQAAVSARNEFQAVTGNSHVNLSEKINSIRQVSNYTNETNSDITKWKYSESMRIEARNHKSLEILLDANESIHWGCRIESQDIDVRVVFIALEQNDSPNASNSLSDTDTNNETTFLGHFERSAQCDDDFVAPTAGILLFQFDNTYSIIRSKSVMWKCTIEAAASTIAQTTVDTRDSVQLSSSALQMAENYEMEHPLPSQCSWSVRTVEQLFGQPLNELWKLPADTSRTRRIKTDKNAIVTEHVSAPIEWTGKSIGQVIEEAQHSKTLSQTMATAQPSTENDVSEQTPVICYPKSRQFRKKVSAKVGMCQDFPLQISSFWPVAEVMARTARHFQNFAQFFETKLPPGFPVKFGIPIVPAVTAKVRFTNVTIGHISHHIMELPEAYEDRTEDLKGVDEEAFWKNMGSR